MMIRSFFTTLLVFSICIQAQSLKDLTFGTDATLDVITWNIEWFPKNDAHGPDSVATIIKALDADIYAFQEIDEPNKMIQVLNSVGGYSYYYQSGYYGGLFYAFKTDEVTIDAQYEIYTSSAYWKAFPRAPQVMEFTFKEQQFVIMDNHLKCCGDGFLNLNNNNDEEKRRLDACQHLHNYITTYFPEDNVMVVGDFNDILTDNSANNVFRMFIDRPAEYEFVDIGIANGPSADWSYPTWPSHLDHILITNELFDEFALADYTCEVIMIDNYLPDGWDEYDQKISDHRPVGAKFGFPVSSVEEGNIPDEFRIGNYPNPFNPTTKITITIPADMTNKLLTVKIYNLHGELIKTLTRDTYPAGNHQLIWNGTNDLNSSVVSGVYFYEVLSGTTRKLGKMNLIK